LDLLLARERVPGYRELRPEVRRYVVRHFRSLALIYTEEAIEQAARMPEILPGVMEALLDCPTDPIKRAQRSARVRVQVEELIKAAIRERTYETMEEMVDDLLTDSRTWWPERFEKERRDEE
jgi:hypothetical protein